MSQHSVVSSCDHLLRQVEHEYTVDPNNVGYCIIINQKNFYMEEDSCLKVGIRGLHSCPCYMFPCLQRFFFS
jgi:hypothetical protein